MDDPLAQMRKWYATKPEVYYGPFIKLLENEVQRARDVVRVLAQPTRTEAENKALEARVAELTAELVAADEAELARYEATVRVAELGAALRGLLDGLDDYWVTLPEGIAALEAARAALAAEKGEP